jgi:hypothetical protein
MCLGLGWIAPSYGADERSVHVDAGFIWKRSLTASASPYSGDTEPDGLVQLMCIDSFTEACGHGWCCVSVTLVSRYSPSTRKTRELTAFHELQNSNSPTFYQK